MIRVSFLIIFKFLLLTNLLQSQECVADAGNNIQICDGDGSSSNYTYLNGGGSSVIDGGVNFAVSLPMIEQSLEAMRADGVQF